MAGDPRFHELLKVLADLHEKKGRDYGQPGETLANLRRSERIDVPAWKAVMVRIEDKMSRLEAYCRTGELHNEGVLDTLLDLSHYSLLMAILMAEKGLVTLPAVARKVVSDYVGRAILDAASRPGPPSDDPCLTGSGVTGAERYAIERQNERTAKLPASKPSPEEALANCKRCRRREPVATVQVTYYNPGRIIGHTENICGECADIVEKALQ